MHLSNLLTFSSLLSLTLAAPPSIERREHKTIEFSSCISTGVKKILKTYPDAILLWARATSAHFAEVQHPNALDVLQLTFESASLNSAIVIQTLQDEQSFHSKGCVFGKEKVYKGRAVTGAAPLDWPSDAGIGIVSADEKLIEKNKWRPFKAVVLGKMFGGEQATYTFEFPDVVGGRVKVGAKNGEIVEGGNPIM